LQRKKGKELKQKREDRQRKTKSLNRLMKVTKKEMKTRLNNKRGKNKIE
jgi:hypothetical protein